MYIHRYNLPVPVIMGVSHFIELKHVFISNLLGEVKREHRSAEMTG